MRLIRRDSNCGSVKNRNYRAELTRSEVLFLIDDDTELPGIHTASEIILEFSNPVVGAVAIPYFQYGVLYHAEPISSGERFVSAIGD